MLGWSINLFKVFGIQLAVHASFLLLLAYYGYEGWIDGGMPGLLWSVGLIVLFFVCVILHELGHSLTARRYGVRTSRILLLPIGGMAELEQIPRKPSAELLITVAGPAVNFAIFGLMAVFFGVPQGFPFHPEFEDSIRGFGQLLLYWNAIMGVFNLVPVFPMDGGRILRALLAIRLPYLTATYWAVMVGRVLSVLLAVGALYKGNYLLGVLFMFIFFAGAAEYRQTLRREREEAYWAEMARRARMVAPVDEEPPLLIHGPN